MSADKHQQSECIRATGTSTNKRPYSTMAQDNDNYTSRCKKKQKVESDKTDTSPDSDRKVEHDELNNKQRKPYRCSARKAFFMRCLNDWYQSDQTLEGLHLEAIIEYVYENRPGTKRFCDSTIRRHIEKEYPHYHIIDRRITQEGF